MSFQNPTTFLDKIGGCEKLDILARKKGKENKLKYLFKIFSKT